MAIFPGLVLRHVFQSAINAPGHEFRLILFIPFRFAGSSAQQERKKQVMTLEHACNVTDVLLMAENLQPPEHGYYTNNRACSRHTHSQLPPATGIQNPE